MAVMAATAVMATAVTAVTKNYNKEIPHNIFVGSFCYSFLQKIPLCFRGILLPVTEFM